MALAVLVFHYDKWLVGAWDANSLQGRLGVYAVSTFFVLSGLTLTLVYEVRLEATVQSWAKFFKKRFWRIFPLLWLATGATLVLDDLPRSWSTILLNFTGLFGFVDPSRDIATGAWSIGCELVFYAAFPTLLWLSKVSRATFFGAFLLLFLLGCWGAFAWFPVEKTAQSDWWEMYVQVKNQAFFFMGGMVIGVFKQGLARIQRTIWILVLVLSILGFVCWPIGSEAFQLISGWNRVVFSGLTLVIVASVFNCKIELSGRIGKMFTWLGAISYSLYLLHPLLFRAVGAVVRKLELGESYWLVFIPALLGALILSHLSYFFLEKPLLERR